jgi:hypothetical protein
MTDLAIVRWIRELDENGAVAGLSEDRRRCTPRAGPINRNDSPPARAPLEPATSAVDTRSGR